MTDMDDRNRLVRFDWAIKRLLRDKANFDVLEGFLASVLGEDIKIIEILESESNKQTADDKFNRVDIKCRNSSDEIIIVEVQNTREVDYMLRILYGVAKTVTEHIRSGEAYENIRKVYSISILYFNLGLGDDYAYRGQTVFRGIHTDNELKMTDEERKIMGFMQPCEVFPEYYLLMVEDFDKVATTPLEEWMDFLKTGVIKEEATAPGLKSARNKLRVLKMSKDEQDAYEKYLHDVASFLLTQKVEREYAHSEGLAEGLEKGREEGLAKGREEGLTKGREEGLAKGREEGLAKGREEGLAEGVEAGKREIACNMLRSGMDIGTVATLTGLTLDELKAMQL